MTGNMCQDRLSVRTSFAVRGYPWPQALTRGSRSALSINSVGFFLSTMSNPRRPKVSFQDVLDYMSQPDLIGDFPSHILEARLKSVGTRAALEKNAIAKWGFPFRYHSPLDEAILVLHYFLTKSQSLLGSYIQIHSTHVPTKEEENTLASWKSPKAGLYLDLHALIENHNQDRGKPGLLKRLFVFRDHAQLAFLESTGIGVILEQESIGIETGFLFNENRERVGEVTNAGVMLVELHHDDITKCEWFLGINKDESQQPYMNDVVCKWHIGRVLENNKLTPEALKEKDEKQSEFDIKKYLDLFKFKKTDPKRKTLRKSYRFEPNPQRFRRLLRANYEAAFRLGEVRLKVFEQHLNVRAIHTNLEQLYLALDETKQSLRIRAIDASSVKNTLKIHEADPNYRHWIRTSVLRALNDRENVSLERVYILDADEEEYQTFQQELGLYSDLMTGRISRLDSHPSIVDKTPLFREPRTFPPNIRIYAITGREVERICELAGEDVRNALAELLQEDFEREETPVEEIMPELDYLYSEKLIFNYKDYKGEPGRAFYDANLFIPQHRKTNSPDTRNLTEEIVKYLPSEEFERRRSKFERFFEILKGRSILVLPSAAGDFPEFADFEAELDSRGNEPIAISELVTDTVAEPSKAEEPPTIFVSHASEDADKVALIRDRLQQEGYIPWHYNWDIPVGYKKIATQNYALRNSDFFLSCCSQYYNRKPGPIQIEISEARELYKQFPPPDHSFILVVQLDGAGVHEDLRDLQELSLFDAQGKIIEEEWDRLMADMKAEWRARMQKGIRVRDGAVVLVKS